MHEPVGFVEGQGAQEKIVNQTEDSGVQPDPESERDHREKSKSGRFTELA